MFQLDPYDGTIDPLDHVKSYKALIKYKAPPMPSFVLPCHALQGCPSLVFSTRAKEHRLLQAVREVYGAFRCLSKDTTRSRQPFSIGQQDGESLGDYAARFKSDALEVHHLDNLMAMLAMKKGLCTSSPTPWIRSIPRPTQSC